MIGLGVIGLGTIFQHQIIALDYLKEEYRLCAVYDINAEKADRYNTLYSCNAYRDIDDFLNDETVEAVLIATPPSTHLELTLRCLESGKNVLLEKPAFLEKNEFNIVYALAMERGLLFHVAYHASFAPDLEWYINNSSDLVKKYNLGELRSVNCEFYDPYMTENRIFPEKRSLGGSFIDSGVNALSVCAKLVDLSDYKLIKKDECADCLQKENEQPVTYESHTEYSDGKVVIVIDTGWNFRKNYKATLLTYENPYAQILLNHSEQQVILIQNGIKELIFRDMSGRERLVNHYIGVFRDFDDCCRHNKMNKTVTLENHRLLLS